MLSKQELLLQVLENKLSLLAVPGYFKCALPGKTVLSICQCMDYQKRVKKSKRMGFFGGSDLITIDCPKGCPLNYTTNEEEL